MQQSLYSTYLGGGSDETGYGIVVDGSGNAYVTGGTYSSDFPTLNPYQTSQGSYDAFVTKLSAMQYFCGDCDGSGQVDLSDAVFLVNYIFNGSPAPNPLASADVDCSKQVDLTDVVYLVNYVFGGGAATCAACK